MHVMKYFSILLIGALVVLSSCSTAPRENDQQAFEANVSEATLFMATLNTLDSGDIAKTRAAAEIPVLVDSASLPYFAAKGHPTPEQKQEMVALARQIRDYMLRHRSDFDPR
jgi:hypothetical protein